MKHTIIDASQFELEEKVVSIKRVTKVVKGGPENILNIPSFLQKSVCHSLMPP